MLGVIFLRNQTQIRQVLLAGCLSAALLLSLAACGRDKSPGASGAGMPSGSGSQVQGDSSAQGPEDSGEETLEGTLNLIDEGLALLVVVNEEGYYRFDLGQADLSGLQPGDEVVVTYTGPLEPDSDEVTAVAVSVEKVEIETQPSESD